MPGTGAKGASRIDIESPIIACVGRLRFSRERTKGKERTEKQSASQAWFDERATCEDSTNSVFSGITNHPSLPRMEGSPRTWTDVWASLGDSKVPPRLRTAGLEGM